LDGGNNGQKWECVPLPCVTETSAKLIEWQLISPSLASGVSIDISKGCSPSVAVLKLRERTCPAGLIDNPRWTAPSALKMVGNF
jgi:hypothetical protein